MRERRKRIRNTVVEDDPLFIEIHHTFGQVRKSVYKIVEFDEYGLSFFVPVAEGYFPVGMPITYHIIQSDLTKTNGKGHVRYFKLHHDSNGMSFYRIGLQVSNTDRDFNADNIAIRPERYRLDGKSYERTIRFIFGDTKYRFELIDISRYSAAFFCSDSDAVIFPVSTVLKQAEIWVGNARLYEGMVLISRIFQDKGKNRVVVEPRKAIFDLERLKQIDEVENAASMGKAVIRKHEGYSRIGNDFKATVSDLRCFLEDYCRFLETPALMASARRDSELDLCGQLFADFFPAVDAKVIAIDTVMQGITLSPEENTDYKYYYQRNLHKYFLTAPFLHRAFFKPSNYAGDYEMMRMIQQDKFNGATTFARLMNAYGVSIPIASAVRSRNDFLARKIEEYVAGSPARSVDVLSVASGPALEITQLIKNAPSSAGKIRLTLLDQEIEALKFSQENIYRHKIQYDCRLSVNFIRIEISRFLKQLASKSKSDELFDMVYAFGVFDYFEERTARFVLSSLLKLLRPAGKLIISNFSLDAHRHRTLMEYGHEWYLVYRSSEELEGLLPESPESYTATVVETEKGLLKYLEVIRL